VSRPERGSATILVLGAAVVVLAFGVTAATLAAALLTGARVRTAADLAALAGADALGAGREPCPYAATVAAANGARLVRCMAEPGAVTVEVQADGPAVLGRPVRARARAEPGGYGSANGIGDVRSTRAPPHPRQRTGRPVRAGLRGWTGLTGTSPALARWAS
jgi:secretion/DNA translocation related TadE-like protein